MKIKEIKKLYYSIGDVSKITNIKQYVLRYWETEFSIIKPSKNRAGNRIYKDSDIKAVNLIKSLLYERKYTIKGAKQYLADNYKTAEQKANIVNLNPTKVDKEYLLSIKAQLEETIELIKKLKD
tara:strand:- start:70 stop:441 length:372 start_codon:yes stop_codon:yes gene_type:complete